VAERKAAAEAEAPGLAERQSLVGTYPVSSSDAGDDE
jgi:hypothetical protein